MLRHLHMRTKLLAEVAKKKWTWFNASLPQCGPRPIESSKVSLHAESYTSVRCRRQQTPRGTDTKSQNVAKRTERYGNIYRQRVYILSSSPQVARLSAVLRNHSGNHSGIRAIPWVGIGNFAMLSGLAIWRASCKWQPNITTEEVIRISREQDTRNDRHE